MPLQWRNQLWQNLEDRCQSEVKFGVWERPFSGVTSDGRIWRKGAGKRGLECGSALQCRNQLWQSLGARTEERLGVWECPFSGVTNDSRIWRKGAGKRGLECGSAPSVA